jgi:hypothetical protein
VTSRDFHVEWLQKRVQHYQANKNDRCEVIEETEDLDKLGQGFTLANPLGWVNIRDGTIPKPTFVNKNLEADYKAKLIELLKEYVECFAWNYHEMPCLSHDLVDHRLPIKTSFRPYKQPARCYNPIIYDQIKEEIYRLLKSNCIRPCRYAE